MRKAHLFRWLKLKKLSEQQYFGILKQSYLIYFKSLSLNLLFTNILILNIIKNSFQNNQNKQTSTIFFFK